MGINREILNEIKTDFYTGPDNQVLNIEDKDPFWEWFMENANGFDICKDFVDLYTNESNLTGNCFGNSLKVSHEEGIDYCEGFSKVKGSFILHGFNLIDNCVIDSTGQSNPELFQDINGRLPTEYYGIIIPTDFLPEELSTSQDNNYINISSRLYDYYLQSIDHTCS